MRREKQNSWFQSNTKFSSVFHYIYFMEWIKAFLKEFKKENDRLKFTKNDILPLVVLFILGFFFGDDIKNFLDSLFN